MPLMNQQAQITNAFVEEFEGEVKHDYQRMGAKLLNSVRRKTGIRGTQTTFQRIGTSKAGKKSRHGTVPLNNSDRTPVPCPVEDFYTGDFVDQLDELKIEHDERGAITTSLSAAMGRQSDQLLINSYRNFTQESTDTGGLTLAKIEGAFAAMGEQDVPDDGQRYLWVSPKAWIDLMNIPQFSNADYIPNDQLPYPMLGFGAKRWYTFIIAMHSGLDKNGNVRECMAFHKSALGHGSAMEIGTDITWQGLQQAWLIVLKMSQGAVRIDDIGGYRVRVTES